MAELIGLGGKLRSGKDALAEYLRDEHDFVVMGMSDALNDALLKLNPWITIISEDGPYVPGYDRVVRYRTLHAQVGYVEAKKNPEVRRLLQVLGTEVGREMISDHVWADIARRRIEGYLSEGKSVVLTALRFPNEIHMIEDLGGLTAWIDRSSEHRGVTEEQAQHASETGVSKEDFEILVSNDGTLEDLYKWGDALVADLRTRPNASPSVNAWPIYDR